MPYAIEHLKMAMVTGDGGQYVRPSHERFSGELGRDDQPVFLDAAGFGGMPVSAIWGI